MKFAKLNMSGFSHIIAPVLVVLAIGAVGTYVLVASHADSCTTNVSGVSAVSAASGVSSVACPKISSAVSSPSSPTYTFKAVDGYTLMNGNTTAKTAIYACKTYINAYGGVYNVKFLFSKPASLTDANGIYYQLRGSRNGATYYVDQSLNSWYTNTVSSLNTNMSALNPVKDVLTAYIGTTKNPSVHSLVSTTLNAATAKNIATCKN